VSFVTAGLPFVVCGEQAQFQQVFDQDRVGADGVVVGHAELCCHGSALAGIVLSP
jgi:hypothetical protein